MALTRPLRVLHVPDSVGGNAPALARAERALGLESVCVVLAESPFAYPVDFALREPGVGRMRYEGRRLRLMLRALREFDVVHFNFGRTILPQYILPLELALLRAAGKALFVTFQGDDARQGEPARQRGGLSLPTQLPHLYPAGADGRKRRRIAWFDRFADGLFYLNPDLAYVLPQRAQFLPYAHVDPRDWVPREHADRAQPLIVHAPSAPELKGTRVVEASLRALRDEGIPFEWTFVQGQSNAEARRVYEQADIGIDQLYAGWYGGVAVEWMALGIPVVTYLRDDDLATLPSRMRDELPLVRTTVATLAQTLRGLLEDDAVRDKAGLRGREFVERWHDPLRIAELLRQRYRAAVSRRSVGTRPTRV